jgi:hypothetical protein
MCVVWACHSDSNAAAKPTYAMGVPNLRGAKNRGKLLNERKKWKAAAAISF